MSFKRGARNGVCPLSGFPGRGSELLFGQAPGVFAAKKTATKAPGHKVTS
ncbi:Uncharacterized protein dnm_007010 [Desulfonema magnum]|uniref:Uncharacterized protein n=1 Tax=Desulfonema magnum TaxID=45655 RepID=A0A975GKJ6_9BACT|nr:Uncharacterized protein dnm_007010 [Desulfonema magnum]